MSHLKILVLLLLSLSLYTTTVLSIDLSNAVYTELQLGTNNNIWAFDFQHPANSAQSSNKLNSFSIVFDDTLPGSSTMSLQIQRDSLIIFSSGDTQPSSDGIFRFQFAEIGGSLRLTLTASQALANSGYKGRAVFNMESLDVKKPDFSEIGNFIYTQQIFKGTYSQFQLYKAYQINVVKAGYFLLKRYDCIGHVEVLLTKQFTRDPKAKALPYTNLIQSANPEYEYSERVYEIKDIGTYYIMILPGYGLSTSLEDGPRAFYRLEVKFLGDKPQTLNIPGSALANLGSIRIEGNQDETSFKVLFDPLEKGLSTILPMNVEYKVVVGTNSIIQAYYLRCGTDAPRLQIGNGPGSQKGDFEWETKERQGVGEGETMSYAVKRINIQETDLAAGVEVSLGSIDGTVSGRIFYRDVNLRKKPKDDVDVAIILVIVFGLLLLLAIPIWKGVQKFLRNRKRKARANQYEVGLEKLKEKPNNFSKMSKDQSANLDVSSSFHFTKEN